MNATLTQRYIDAVVRSLPPASRDDVQAELEVSIADAIEARTATGEAADVSEREVLTNLGDPGILAAGYADRPLHLVGPRFYLTWLRLLRLLWAIIPPVAMGGVALGKALSGAPIGDIFGSVISVGLAVVIHVAFWVTLVFVILERTGSASTIAEWSVDRLPEIRTRGAVRADMIAAIVLLAVGVAVLFWDRFRGLVIIDDRSLPVLNPELWPWWITGLLVLMVAKSALVIAVYFSGRWSAIFATANTALALVFAISAVGLLTVGHLLNPEFITIAFTNNGVNSDTTRILAVILGAGIIGFGVWDIIDGWLKTIRDNRR
ncbi:MAG: hypothetical protein KF739_09995 [Cryobacterium sp.]|nr:hypothetical protein [Cryobacterium sp.]